MEDNNTKDLNEAVTCLREGGLIAYPTEAVYGLGCDPFSIDAITRLLQLKHRSISKGFILIAANYAQLEQFILPIDPQALAHVFASWPGPVTWAFPTSKETPLWIRGEHRTVAVRITNHPIAKKLCERFGGAIVSTSANVEGHPPMRDEKMLRMAFGDKIDKIVPGKVGGALRPTEIRDAITGEIIRAG
ncbi:Sua5/YciO/YrdC/YwlC family protein [Candidiatus Paracoxiella cheracis]|uniref:Sua5/YciO/YrdC/YwlC family protein n=1 Tax=Candidiatus Paracoxiella cheracis TaxID=3405120 RepID=UPI003BF555EF